MAAATLAVVLGASCGVTPASGAAAEPPGAAVTDVELRAALGRTAADGGVPPAADLNGDGVINVLDVGRFRGVGPRDGWTGPGPAGAVESIVIDPAISASPGGGTVMVLFRLEDNTTPMLGYSLEVRATPVAGALGSVTADIPATNFYDERNVITQAPGTVQRDPFFSVIQADGPDGVFINAITDDLSTVTAVAGVNDVFAQVVLNVSADACGTFEVHLGPATVLADGLASAIPHSYAPGTITVECGRCCFNIGLPQRGCISPMTPAECDGQPGVTSFIAGQTCAGAMDCNGNQIPDECESQGDCNGNGVPDGCDIAGPNSADCNGNGVPDECDIEFGGFADCNGNGVPDVCTGVPSRTYDIALADLLNVPSDCGNGSVYNGCSQNPGFAWTDTGSGAVTGVLVSFNIGVECQSVGTMRNTSLNGVAGPGYAVPMVFCGCESTSGHVSALTLNTANYEVGGWNTFEIAGGATCIGFAPQAVWGGAYARVTVTYGQESDCNGDAVPDDCEIAAGTGSDCNDNGTLDECDLAAGTSVDCNGNGIPDDCVSGGPTVFDIPAANLVSATGSCGNGSWYGCPPASPGFTWTDSDAAPATAVRVELNVGVECQSNGSSHGTTLNGIAGPAFTAVNYCNCTATPGRVVALDMNPSSYIAGGTNTFRVGTTACAGFIPQSAWGSGVYARVTVERGFESDCNENGVPDDCDLAGGQSEDCNANGVPDECDATEEDCNGNGIPDDCTGSSSIVYSITSASFLAPTQNCGSGPYTCNPFFGFQWEDTGSGSVSGIQVEFNQGVECAAIGTTHTTTLNNQASVSYVTTARHCSCAYVPATLITLNAAPGGYVVGGWNAFRITGLASCLGLVADPARGELVYGRVTVTYAGEVDCDGNGSPDECDIGGGQAEDCNNNGLPDACDLAEGFSEDCNGDIIPDECQLGDSNQTVMAAVQRGWWPSSGAHTAVNNNTLTGDFSTGVVDNSYFLFDASKIGSVTAPPVLRLEIERYSSPHSFERFTIYDVSTNAAVLEADGTSSVIFKDLENGDAYGTFTVTASDVGKVVEIPLNALAQEDLSRAGEYFAVGVHIITADAAGSSEWVRFSSASEYRVHELVAMVGGDCNANGIPDDCDVTSGYSVDCNANSVPDECDIADGSSTDCNGNVIPDDCEVGQTVMYTMQSSNLLGVPTNCGSGPYGCGGQQAFQWTDPDTRPVVAVRVEYNLGVNCFVAGQTIGGKMNAATVGGHVNERYCSCTGTAGVEGFMTAPAATYAVGASNTFSFQSGSTCLGFTPNAEWGGGDYGRVFVTYAMPSDGNANGVLDACEKVHFVDRDATGANNGATWANAYTSLSTALGVCQAGNQIWVAEGSYPATGVWGFHLVDACSVYGGFAGTETQLSQRNPTLRETILTGDLGGNDPIITDNALHVVTVFDDVEPPTTLDGFTIQRGYADGTNSFDKGGAGLINYGGKAALRQLVFRDNFGLGTGGAMYLSNSTGMVIDRCRFFSNSAMISAGVGYITGGDPMFTNCLFNGNQATGAAPQGAGGAFHIVNSDPLFLNCTFTLNTATSTGGAIMNDFIAGGSNPVLTNCILWNNSDAGGADESGQMHTAAGTPVVTYTDWQGHTGGTGNINADPNFDAGFAPLWPSPVMDAGTNDAPGLPAWDLSGNVRIRNGTVDMGAYEFQSGAAGESMVDDRGLGASDETKHSGPTRARGR